MKSSTARARCSWAVLAVALVVPACNTRASDDDAARMRAADAAGVLALPLHHLEPASGRLAAGFGHTCALRDDGSVWCWGRNGDGQLGSATGGGARPVPVQGLDGAVALTAGEGHSCALRRDGTVWCWGANRFCQLGVCGRADPAKPAAVPGLVDAVAVAAGMVQTCAVRHGGGLLCWGDTAGRGVGEAQRFDPLAPDAGGDPVRSVAVSISGACAVHQPAAVSCWNLSTPGSRNPANLRRIAPLDEPWLVAVGQHGSCALLAHGDVACWGARLVGPLGTGPGNPLQDPLRIRGVVGARTLGVGEQHACALVSDGRVLCWGGNPDGQRGDPSRSYEVALVTRRGLGRVVDLAVGFRHSCAVLEDGGVRCWGDGHDGVLGGEPSPPWAVVGVCAAGTWDGTRCVDGTLFTLGNARVRADIDVATGAQRGTSP